MQTTQATVDVDKIAATFSELRRRFPTTSSARNMRDAFWSVVGHEPWGAGDLAAGRCGADDFEAHALVMFLAFERAEAAK